MKVSVQLFFCLMLWGAHLSPMVGCKKWLRIVQIHENVRAWRLRCIKEDLMLATVPLMTKTVLKFPVQYYGPGQRIYKEIVVSEEDRVTAGIFSLWMKDSLVTSSLLASMHHDQFLPIITQKHTTFLLADQYVGKEFIVKKLTECACFMPEDKADITALLSILIANDPNNNQLMRFCCDDFARALTFISVGDLEWLFLKFCCNDFGRARVFISVDDLKRLYTRASPEIQKRLQQAYKKHINLCKNQDGKVVLPEGQSRIPEYESDDL